MIESVEARAERLLEEERRRTTVMTLANNDKRQEIRTLRGQRDDLLAALKWALPYLAEVPLPPDDQALRDRYARKLYAAEEAIRKAGEE